MPEFDQRDVRSLSEKLQALDLTEGETNALEAVLTAAEDREVEGFSTVKSDVHPFGIDRLMSIAIRPVPRPAASQVVINHEEQY